MPIDLTLDNYRLVRAGWTAMDQTYRPLSIGNSLLPVDNSGQGRTQPFAVPDGFVVSGVVTGEISGLQVGIYWNQDTHEMLVVPMGTNGWGALGQWRDNVAGSLGRDAWNEVKGEVFESMNNTLRDNGGGSLIWVGDSRAGAISQYGMSDLALGQMPGPDGQPSQLTAGGFSYLQDLNLTENMAGVFHSSPGVTWGMSPAEAQQAQALLANVPCDITADRTGGTQELVTQVGGDMVCGGGLMKFTDTGDGASDPLSRHQLVDNAWTAIADAHGDFSQRTDGVRQTLSVETAMHVGSACANALNDESLATNPEEAVRIVMGLTCSTVFSPPGTAFDLVQATTQDYLGEAGSNFLAGIAEIGKWLHIAPLAAATGLANVVGVPVAAILENGTQSNGAPHPLSLAEAAILILGRRGRVLVRHPSGLSDKIGRNS
jgi:hypothetical protein